MRTSRRVIAAIWVVALALRAAYLLEISRAPFFALRLGDAEAYHAWAVRIAGGDWLGSGVFYQAPLYPYFLAVVYRILGDGTTGIRIVQALLGASSCALLAAAGTSLFGRAGALAGVLLAFHPAAIYFDGLLEKTSLVMCLTTLLVALLTVSPERAGVRRAAAVGIALGLLVLTRENALLLAPVAVLWIVVGWPAASSVRGRAAAAFVAALLLTLLPVGVRNRVAGGEFHLTTSQFGPNFYIGNHRGASGTYDALVPGHGSAADERDDATRLAEQAAGRRLGAGEVSAYWARRAFDDIRADPAGWLRLSGRKLALTINAAEIADTEAREVYAEWSAVLRLLEPFGFGVVLAVAAFGGVLTARSWRRIWVLYAIAATYAISVAAFFVLERYRLPIVPVLILLAAGGAGEAAAGWHAHRRRFMAACAAALAAYVAARAPLADERGARAAHLTGIAGVMSADPRRHDEAIAFYGRALDDAPQSPVARFGLGTLLVRMGRAHDAVPHLQAAIAARPDYAEAHFNLGVALSEAARPQEALDAYRAALRLRPDDLDARLAIAKAHLALERPGAAADEYRQALKTQPRSIPALVGLGVALTHAGRVDEALAAYDAALAVGADDASIYNNIGFTLASVGRIAEAIPHFERALALDPWDENARRNLAKAREVMRED